MPPFLSRVVSLAFALVGSLVAQGRGPALAAALARGDRAAAEAIAEAEPDPARRALCEAALQPLPQRVGAFLSVAQRFPRHDACGEALLAGCATVLLQQERWPAQLGPLPDLAEALGDAWWWGRRDPRCAERLAVVVPALLHEVRRWEAERPRARELPLLQRLARSCACPVVRSTPLTIASGEEWPLPQPLGEDLLVAVRRLDDDASTPLDLVDALARDSSRRWLVPAREGLAALPSPGDGRWLLEVQSVSQPWRALRVVDVGSLRATVFADPGVVVWVADGDLWSDDGSITWTGRVDADPPIPMPPATGGIGVWRLPPHLGPRGFVQARQGDARARIPVWESDARAAPRELAVAHWQCDRPLHRPGEQVQGRVVVRAVSWQGTGLAAVPTTAAVAASAVPFVCTWPDGTREERRLDLDARGIATFAVQVPAGATPGRACAELGPLPNGASLRCELTEVAAFRRPAVVGELRGPERVALADGNVVLRLQVAWASGGPAAVPVDVAVGRADEWTRERRRLATGADGALAVPIDVREHGGERLECRCEIHGPDGHVEALVHTVAVVAPPTPAAARDSAAPFVVAFEYNGVVGGQVLLALRGSRYTSVVVLVGRGREARAVPVSLGGDGTCRLPIDVLPCDWPRLDVTVVPAGTEQRQRASVPVRRAAAKPLRLEVPDVAQPGGSVRCVATAGAGDLVTFAVVDDRLFRLRPDPTRTPDEALRPHVPKPSWSIHRSPECDDARLVFGGLLVDGRVPAPGDLSESTPSAGGASGPAGAAAAGGGELRSDFRTTACFRTVVADASGRAVLEFAVPDDVTTWRVTATAVDGEGEGTLARAMFAARLPLAAEVLLPRVLRVGDRVEVPLVLDRAAHAMGDDTVRLEVAAKGALRHDGAAAVAAVVARGDVRTVTIPLSAPQAGEGVVRCAATQAANVDRSERRVPVAADGVAATVANAAAGRGVVAVDVPAERSPGAPVQVDVLAGGAAAWRQLADRLQEYPYGCVEQTLSRLLPFAAGGAVAGDPVLRADRIGKGMARLRQLQCGRSGPFAFWPGGDADLAMTGLVLHGLAALRAGGVDAAAYGLRIDQAALLAQATNAADATSFAALELLAGLLRFSPDDAAVRAAVAARVDAAAPMPRGTALRLGLALSAAGDRARAQRCRQGLPTGAEAPGFPGSDPTVHLAHELELDRALGAAIAPQREMELVRELLGSGCRTYTDAVALLALAPGLGNGGADVPVEIVVDGGAATPLRLTSAGGMQGRQRLDGGRRIEVRTADARELLFVRVAATTLRRGNGPAWAAPFVVERQLSGPGVVVGVGGVAAVRVGERVRVALRFETPVRARYVAVVCPLPAGWELLGDAPWLQRFDDRVVFAWPDLAAHGVRTFTFDVVPTVAGAVAWPPVVAEAMYEPTQTGGSEGCRVQVLPREAAAPAPVVLPFLLAAPAAVATPVAAPAAVPAPPSLDERLAAAAATIESVWFEAVLPRGIYGFDDAPADEARAKLAAALQLLEASAADVPKSVVRHLPVPMSREQRPRGAKLAPWRRELLARLWQLQERCLESTLADCERHLATEPDHAAVETAVRALPAARAEALAQRALALLWPTNVGAVENLVDALPVELRDERLQMQLVAMLASGEPEFAVEVVSRLPEHWLADVAPGALVQALPNLYDEHTRTVVRVLQRTAPGRRALRAMLADPELAGGLPVELWPDEACTGLPASAWARMAEDDGARARALLAGGAVPVPTLWQWLLARGDGVPLEVLAMALWDRGEAPPADVMAAPTADPTVMALRALLAARHDAARLEDALAAARPLFAAEAGDDVEEVVTTVVGKLVGSHGDVAAVREFARALAPSDWRAVWRRMPAAAAPVLLQLDDDFGYGLPTTDEVLGRLLQRAFDRGDLRDAVLAIGAEPEGLTRLLAVRAQSAAARRADLDDALHRLGLDPASGGAAADASSFVLPFAAHGAWDGTWPPSLQVARDDLLSFRGLR